MWKFEENPKVNFWVTLFTNKLTNKLTDRQMPMILCSTSFKVVITKNPKTEICEFLWISMARYIFYGAHILMEINLSWLPMNHVRPWYKMYPDFVPALLAPTTKLYDYLIRNNYWYFLWPIHEIGQIFCLHNLFLHVSLKFIHTFTPIILLHKANRPITKSNILPHS